MKRILAVTHILMLGAVCWKGQAADKHPRAASNKFTPRNVMWQALPDQVSQVFVGPDDRVWYKFQKGDGREVSKLIKEEFHKPTPRLHGITPRLFEPDGRVWFEQYVDGDRLLGYDGVTLIEKKAGPGHSFVGTCPNHGRRRRSTHNLFLENTAFFLESHGILTFSKGVWGYRQMSYSEPLKRKLSYPSLYAEPDGEGVTALLMDKDKTCVWRWRSGKWTELQIPEVIEPGNIEGVAPWKNGIWFFTKSGAVYHSYHTDMDKIFPDLLAKLGADSFMVRKQAMTDMIDLGQTVRVRAEKALTDAVDPEVRDRLKKVIKDVTPGKEPQMVFGPYRLTHPELILYDGDATMYLGAFDIAKNGKSLGSGFVVGMKDGSISATTGRHLRYRWRSYYHEDSGPLVVKTGKCIWLPRADDGSGPGLMDFEKKKYTALMPNPRVSWLHALKADGTIFAGRREAGQSDAGPLMRFSPDLPDDRNLLKCKVLEVSENSQFSVSSDGFVWAEIPSKGIVRFNGKDWRTVEGLSIKRVRSFLPGNDGAMIIAMHDKCALVVGNRVEERDSMKDLIADFSTDMKKHFKSVANASWLSVTPDSNGHIWLRDTRELSVFVDGRWIEAKEILKAAGSRAGEAEYVGDCGKGNIYVTDFTSAHSRGRSFFGEVEDGELVFSDAPHICESKAMHRSVIDNDGGLWVVGNVRRALGTCDFVGEQFSLRVVGKKVLSEHKNSGWAKLNDKNGNIWLGEVNRRSAGLFNVWRDGKVVHSITVPGTTEDSLLFSDRPGSVFVWTSLGLQRLKTEGSEKPSSYSLGKLYDIDRFPGSGRGAKYSRLGYVVARYRETISFPRKSLLYLVELPQ